MNTVSLFTLVRRSVLLWFGSAWFLVGSLILLAGAGELRAEREFRRASREAEAVVVDRSILRASRDGPASTEYRVAYRFTTPAGTMVEDTATVEVEEWERLPAGSLLSVWYLPGAPSESRFAGESRVEAPLVMVILGGVFGLIGGVFFFRSARGVWKEYRLHRTGAAARGTVLAIVPTGTVINRVRQWEVHYRYRDSRGEVHEGHSSTLPPDEAHAVPVGDTGAVRYDPDHPEDSVWAGAE
ncbi:MAG TPA: DUF3592 domain-containing protein [Longimicrobiaceae bacterium]|nr:DUF3592 domain-containing protein [Longimicrobiaceae bacterium]